MNKICFYFVIFLLTGCSLAKFEDVSHYKEYAGVVAMKYQTLVELRIHGVTLDENYLQVVDRYSVTEMPGFGGPELVSSKTLIAGSVIEIKRVLRCTNCIPSRIEFVIEILSEQLDQSVPIYLDDLSVINKTKNHLVMDPNLFLEVGQ